MPGVSDDEGCGLGADAPGRGARDTRPLYSITCEDEGTEVVVTVGEDRVSAIIAGEAFYIFEGPEDWRSVPLEAITETWFFDDA